jgi:hypothetical protein
VRNHLGGREFAAERAEVESGTGSKEQARNFDPGEVVPKGAAASGERKAVSRLGLHRR